ncbi:allophanate hydrolase subunit 1 [Hasllibacter sp. MH4015]|uniref:5-oxoprolinase subunit B family protein n=1 Tax=Hasllibacter sp. MH4015 TaxID=2854029 RepID=UPI001CD1DA9A|nr:allophanate hydrolase subunit 1 [Hasllibacter sp. MH4015]
MQDGRHTYPRIRNVGVDGLLVSFADALSEPANRAALAFRQALEREGWDGVEETSTSLVSTYVRFDPLAVDFADLRARVEAVLGDRDWTDAELPEGRKLWRIPTVYEGDYAPQLEEAAAMAGLSPEAALAEISTTRVRVQTIGFAPGQPYLGPLPEAWDIPRQTELTKQVPVGAVTVAIRQIVLFSVSAPTGWRQVGQTAFQLFRKDDDAPFVPRPGDEVLFDPVGADAFDNLRASGPDGGATWTRLP